MNCVYRGLKHTYSSHILTVEIDLWNSSSNIHLFSIIAFGAEAYHRYHRAKVGYALDKLLVYHSSNRERQTSTL